MRSRDGECYDSENRTFVVSSSAWASYRHGMMQGSAGFAECKAIAIVPLLLAFACRATSRSTTHLAQWALCVADGCLLILFYQQLARLASTEKKKIQASTPRVFWYLLRNSDTANRSVQLLIPKNARKLYRIRFFIPKSTREDRFRATFSLAEFSDSSDELSARFWALAKAKRANVNCE